MHLRHAAVLALVGWLTLPIQARAQSSTLTLRQAFLPVPNVMNESADPAKFKPAPLNVVLHHYIFLPGWIKEKEFDDLRDWLIEQGFVIVRANGPAPCTTYPSIKFRTNVGKFNQAFHVTVMERSAGFPWCYSVFTDLLMPARFAPKNSRYIEGYSIGPDESGVGSCHWMWKLVRGCTARGSRASAKAIELRLIAMELA
jgi:hypothetical protein